MKKLKKSYSVNIDFSTYDRLDKMLTIQTKNRDYENCHYLILNKLGNFFFHELIQRIRDAVKKEQTGTY